MPSYVKNKYIRREGLISFSSGNPFLKIAAAEKPGWGSKAMSGLNTGISALYYLDTARQVATGETSVGGALGDVGGFAIGNKASDKLIKPGIGKVLGKVMNVKKGPGKWINGIAGFIGGDLVASSAIGAVGKKIGDKIIPWKRNVNKIQSPSSPTPKLTTRVNMNPYRNN